MIMLRWRVEIPPGQEPQAFPQNPLHPAIKAVNPVRRPPAVACEKYHDIFHRTQHRFSNPLRQKMCMNFAPLDVGVGALHPRRRENTGKDERSVRRGEEAHVRERVEKEERSRPSGHGGAPEYNVRLIKRNTSRRMRRLFVFYRC